MRRGLFIFSLLLLGLPLHAQFDFGVKAGLGTTFTSIESTSSDIKNGNAELGFSTGVFTRFGSKSIKIMPELLYTSTKTSVKVNDLTANSVLDSKLDRIDVPVSLVVKPISLINLSGGLIGSYLMTDNGTLIDNTEEAFKNYKDFSVGYQFGGGVELANLIIDLEFERSLSSLIDSDSIAGFAVDERINMVKGTVGFKLF